MPVSRFLCLLLCSWGLPGAELVVRDVGLSIGVVPSSFSYDLTNAARSRSGDDAFATNLEVEGRGRYSLAGTGESWGAVVGTGVAVQRAGYGSGGGWLSSQVRALAGIGWALSDRLTLLGEAELGLGVGTLRIDGGASFPEQRYRGAVLAPGLRATVLTTLSEQWYGSLSAGWRQTRGTFSGDGADLALTISGFTAALGAEWRFSARPALLE